MVKVRSLRQALAYIKSLDKDTCISENAIRMLVVSGKVPSVMIGKKYLVNVDTLIDYFEERLTVPETVLSPKDEEYSEIGSDIRPVPEHLKRQKTSA